jgi:hypothetical protein
VEPSPEDDTLSQILNRLSDLENSLSTNTFVEGDTYIDDTDEFAYFFQYFFNYFYPGTGDITGDLGIAVYGNSHINVDIPTNKTFGLHFADSNGDEYAGLDAQLRVAPGDGISLEASYGVTVDLATDPGLEFDGTTPDGKLRVKANTDAVKANTDAGLEIDGDGIGINNGCGLTFEDGALVLNYATNSGLKCESGELSINRRYGVNLSNNYLDVVSASIDFSVTPAATGNVNETGTGHGIYFLADEPKGLLLAPGDWLYIVP